MTLLNKYSSLSLAVSLILSTALASPYSIAQEEAEIVKVKHKVIQMSQQSEAETTIEIEQNGNTQVIELSAEELADKSLLESKLANLDEETRAIVMQTLTQNKMHHGNGHGRKHAKHKMKMLVDGANVEHDIDYDVDNSGKHVKEIMVINDGDNVVFKGAMKGHYKAIIRLIEKGEFTPEQVAEIQSALDAKY